MGRPLRAVYANTTYSNGVQEMSDSDIDALSSQLIGVYCAANPTTAYGTSLLATILYGGYGVSRGVVFDSRSSSGINDHPVSNTIIRPYDFQQTEKTLATQTLALTARPVQYLANGNIQEMSNSDIITYMCPPIVQTMITGGAGGHYLGLTSSGAPATGTWVSTSTLDDNYYNASNTLISDSYTLWQRTTGASTTNIRPLKKSGTSLREMSDTDIQNLYQFVGEYIRTTGIGQYAVQTSAPSTGTWINRGSYTNTVNNLVDTSYVGSYVGYFTATYTGAYTQAFTGSYAGSYTQAFTGSYAGTYTGGFTSAFTGAYTRAYNSPGHTSYGPTVTYASVPFNSTYTGIYNGTFSRTFTGSYVGTYSGAFTGSYVGTYSGAFTGTYNTAYSGTFTGAYSGLTTQSSTTSTTYYLWVRTA